MSEIPENFWGSDTGQTSCCRVAYTINDEQPVRCTIIGDQPFFYMDFEGALDEEEGFDDFFSEIDEIERGVLAMQEKISGASGINAEMSLEGASSAIKTMELFLEDTSFATAPHLASKETGKEADEEKNIAEITDILKRSRLAASFLDFAAQHKGSIYMSAQTDTAFYDRKSGHIFINPYLDRTNQVLLVARELRRLWQHRNGSLLNPLIFQPDQAILVNRAQMADLSVVMVRIAWELQLAGDKEPWDRIETSSLADLGRAFARESCLDFRTLNNGSACSAVFEAWFLSDRCQHEDRKLIQEMLADYRGYVFDAEQSSGHVRAGLVVALGTMPFGKNYLAPYVNTITSDAVFTDVRDRSNANFLWFIKFERSFRETEQELQSTETIHSRGDSHGDSYKKQKRIGEDEKTADIITLPDGKAGSSFTEAPVGLSSSGGAKIIKLQEFRHRSGEG